MFIPTQHACGEATWLKKKTYGCAGVCHVIKIKKSPSKGLILRELH